MNKEERLTKSMLDMANGAIKERVDVEMPRIIKNIMDVNTNATKPRKMMLTQASAWVWELDHSTVAHTKKSRTYPDINMNFRCLILSATSPTRMPQ